MVENFGTQTINVRHQLTKEKIEVQVNLGNSLQESVELFGEDVVYTNFVLGAKTQARNLLYSLTHAEKDDEGNVDESSVKSAEEAKAALAAWVPKVPGARAAKDSMATLVARLSQLSPEDYERVMAAARAAKES